MQQQKSALENNEYIQLLNDHLSMLRAQAGLSQASIADLIGIARTTYSAIENKRRRMTFPVFLSLSKYFFDNPKTKNIMELLGLTSEVLEPFFRINSIVEAKSKNTEVKKVAAFGGNIEENIDIDRQRKIERVLKGLDK